LDIISVAYGQEFNFYSDRIPSWNGWLASMVLDSKGNHVGVDGTSKSISNSEDIKLLMALRAKCDVIVTTGKTARIEAYKASRFAPIAIVSRQPKPLDGIPAFSQTGAFESIVLKSEGLELDFDELGRQLTSLGFNKFLFEGGPSTMSQLLRSNVASELVLSVVDVDSSKKFEPRKIAETRLGLGSEFELADDFLAEKNRVTRWVRKG
jgi:riboflavin biosynthesis pyrimidine reductase